MTARISQNPPDTGNRRGALGWLAVRGGTGLAFGNSKQKTRTKVKTMNRRTTRGFRSELLEQRSMLSATIVESEPNNLPANADVVALDLSDNAAQYSGIIATRDDRDFFRFTVPASGNLQIAVSSNSGLVAKLEVRKSQGAQVFETEPKNGVQSGTIAVEAGQSYIARVRSQDKTIGSYSIALSLSDPNSPDPNLNPAEIVVESEPNDRAAQANGAELGPDGQVTLAGVSVSDRDKDFFRITPASSGNLTVAVRPDGGQLAKLEVTNQAGADVFETEPNNGVHAGTFAVQAGATYWLRLRSPNNAPAPYLVDVALTQDAGIAAAVSLAKVDSTSSSDDHGGHGRDDGALVDDRGADRQNDRRRDRQADRSQELGDDRLLVPTAHVATSVDDRATDRQSRRREERQDDRVSEADDVRREDRRSDRRID